MSLRRGKLIEEDAAQLKLGPDFDDAPCFSVSEVMLLLDHRAQAADTTVYKKTVEYVTTFARFGSTDTVSAARHVLSKDDDLKPFEMAQLATLCPEDADEAKSLIPSLARKEDVQLDALLHEISGLKKYSN